MKMHRTSRRIFIAGTTAVIANSIWATESSPRIEQACQVLDASCRSGQVRGASLYVRDGQNEFSKSFGDAKQSDASFLLGSITKPIVIAALMTLYQENRFDLNDKVQKYIPEFHGDNRDRVLISHLLSHVSGLPDQLTENASLRASHAPLSEFVKGTMKVPLGFEPGTRYEYSSMGILLASEIAQRLSNMEIREFVFKRIIQPLGMTHSALGKGNLASDQVMPCQVEFGAVEAGGGSAESKHWDWNSDYWRGLGAPWGGGQASAPDIGKFLGEFGKPTGVIFDRKVASLMIENHNSPGLKPRGLGFDLRVRECCPNGSEKTFGHTGSTGTVAWCDPIRDRVCVILTTLPAQAVSNHPRVKASQYIDAGA